VKVYRSFDVVLTVDLDEDDERGEDDVRALIWKAITTTLKAEDGLIVAIDLVEETT
jgi:hypothetical protein